MAGETTQTTTSNTTSASTTGDANTTSTTSSSGNTSTTTQTQQTQGNASGSSILGDASKAGDKNASTTGAADKKTEGTDKNATTAGAELELKLPEGFDGKDPVLADFKGVAKEIGLDSAKAQKLLDLYVKQGEPLRAEIAKQQAERAQWEGQLKADKDFGGAQYDANIAAVRTLASKYEGGAEALKAIHDAGIGSNPAVVKFLSRVGRSLSDDSVRGGAAPKQTTEADVIASTYPNTKWNS